MRTRRSSNAGIKQNAELSLIQAALDRQEIVFLEEKTFLINMLIQDHIKMRFYIGEDVGLLGHGFMYRWLEFHGIFSITESEKQKMFKRVSDEFPSNEPDWIKERCQLVAYNEYLKLLEENNPNLK